jgi:tRNA(adenine34) deaminase
MQIALQQAQKAADLGEVPVGAVLVDKDNQQIAASHNQPILGHDPTAHAEIMVLRSGAQIKQNYRLIGSTLYVTLEPCVMCVGAMIHARIKRLVYGAKEYKTGAIQSSCQLLEQVRFNHQIELQSGILQQPCADILSEFFSQRRAQKKTEKTRGEE